MAFGMQTLPFQQSWSNLPPNSDNAMIIIAPIAQGSLDPQALGPKNKRAIALISNSMMWLHSFADCAPMLSGFESASVSGRIEILSNQSIPLI